MAFAPHRRPTSACGPQQEARYRSAPAYSWGRPSPRGGGRPPVYISKDNESDLLCTHSPGPVYNVRTAPASEGITFGASLDRSPFERPKHRQTPDARQLPSAITVVQPESQKNNARSITLGARIVSPRERVRDAAPGHLSPRTFGTATSNSRFMTPRVFGFGKQERFSDPAGRWLSPPAPPPGTYDVVYMSPRARPASSFGRDLRERRSAQTFGYLAPGPGAHSPRKNQAVGKQVLSTRRSHAGFGFGTSERFATKEAWTSARVPGPGRYTP